MKKILVVDDDQAILDITKIILESDGYKVDAYENGDVINSLVTNQKKELPSLVLLDLLLAGEDGRELCKQLKKNPRTKNIPVILFSAHLWEDNNSELTGVNYDYFLPKPFDINQLSTVVHDLTAKEN